MMLFWSMIAIVLTYSIVVGLHEFGHALVAAYFKIHIQDISFGFGKTLLRLRSTRGHDWVWKVWPLGGSVKLLNTRIQSVPKERWLFCFDKKPVRIRILVLFAGVAMNFIVAWLCFFSIGLLGYERPLPVIQQILPNTLAQRAGFHTGDRLLSFNGVSLESWQAASSELLSTIGRENLNIIYQNQRGSVLKTQLPLKQWRPTLTALSLWKQLGIHPNYKIKQIHPPKSLPNALQFSALSWVKSVCFFYISLYQVLTGHIPLFLLVGPIGFFELTIRSFLQGFSTYLFFIAYFNQAMGVVNLLPIPGLDGGHVLYACIEKVRGRPISLAWEMLVHRLLTICLWVFLAQLLANELRVMSI